MKVIAKLGMGLSLVLLSLVLSLIVVFQIVNRPPRPAGADLVKQVQIKQGTSISVIARKLAAEELIRSPFFFRHLARLKGLDRQIKAGTYRLPVGLNSVELIALLGEGQPEEVFRVTLAEGLTVRQMGIKIEQEGIASREEFQAAVRDPQLLAEFAIPAASAEGYLFPDTYFWPKNFDARQLVRIMLENFFLRLGRLDNDPELSPTELHRRVIMASIVEKEYKNADEASLIASVFYNRLQANRRLESCATVLYVITEELGRPHPSRIFFSDLEIPSTYNTYLQPQLPPGPISNPGLVAIKAALQPEKTNYFFFVVKDASQGTHTFSETFDDHNRARELYLENFIS